MYRYNYLSAPYSYTQIIKLYCSAKENADEIHWTMKSVYMNKISTTELVYLLIYLHHHRCTNIFIKYEMTHYQQTTPAKTTVQMF